MRDLIGDLTSYLKAIFAQTSQVIFTFLDVVGLVLFVYPSLAQGLQSDESLTRIIAGSILFLSFFLGNFTLYRNLARDIPYWADIRFRLIEHEFTHPYGSGFIPFEEFRKYSYGFNGQGVPCWCMLWARLEGSNRGMEDGKLDFQVVKTELPALFDRDRVQCNFTPISTVAGRSHIRIDMNIFAVVSRTEPEDFARSHKALCHSKATYEVVVRYKTIWVDGESKQEQLVIRGDLDDFCRKMVQHWNEHGFQHLTEKVETG